MKSYVARKCLISIHFPKCGGSSLREVLSGWFKGRFYTHYYNEVGNEYPKKINWFLRNQGFFDGHGPCIHGHFNKDRGFGLDDYYPSEKQFIAFVRDPLDIYISNYNYINQNNIFRNGKKLVIEHDIHDYILRVSEEKSSWFLAHLPKDIADQNLYDYLEDKFVFVGVMERFQESLDGLAKALNMQYCNQVHKNTSIGSTLDLDERVVARFRESHSFDYKLLDYALLKLGEDGV